MSGWCMGNGKKIKFWTDHWLDNECCLSDYVDMATHFIDEYLTLADITVNTDSFSSVLLDYIVDKISALQRPTGNEEEKQI